MCLAIAVQVARGLQHEKNQLYASVDGNFGIVVDVAAEQWSAQLCMMSQYLVHLQICKF